jgi:RNA polymerase sigma-70 factor (ECF subfamily)
VVREGFAELLSRAQAGDEEAFSRLWLELNPRLVRYLSLEPGRNAEDLAAETWVSVVKGLRRFRGDEIAWRAWVFTTARRRALDDARRRSRRPREVSSGDLTDRAWAVPDPTDAVVDDLSPGAALALLSTLPPLQAEVLALRVLAGLPVETVAAMVGKSPGAVRVSAHRGLRTLAATLRSQGVTR